MIDVMTELAQKMGLPEVRFFHSNSFVQEKEEYIALLLLLFIWDSSLL